MNKQIVRKSAYAVGSITGFLIGRATKVKFSIIASFVGGVLGTIAGEGLVEVLGMDEKPDQ